MAQPEFTLIPVFAAFLDGFDIEESIGGGEVTDLAVTCRECMDEVTVLTPDMTLRQVVEAVTNHRCDE